MRLHSRIALGTVCAVLLPRVAQGSPTGGAFAGPTEATGASLYWNPAALAATPPGVGTLVETTGMFLRLDFQREPVDPTHAPYPKVGFYEAGPDFSFAVTLPSPEPVSWLRWVVGGFAPSTGAARWPRNGPQRHHSGFSYAISYAAAAGVVVAPSDKLGFAALWGPYYTQIKLEYAMDFGAYANSKLPAGADLFTLEDPALEGFVTLRTHGWSSLLILGAWAEPTPALRLGVSLVAPRANHVAGDVNVVAPPAVTAALPDYEIKPRGAVTFYYPLPWFLSTEVALRLPALELAGMFQYSRRKVQHTITGVIANATPSFIDGPQLSLKETGDDWMVGARLSHSFSSQWDGAVRLDYDPRYVPTEAINACNLDFTTIEASLALRWHGAEGKQITATYGYVYLTPIEVEKTIYNPRAPSSSGLAVPQPLGRYDGWMHKLTVSFDGFFGA